MKFPQKYTLQQVATIITAEFVGDANFPVYGMNEIHVVDEGDIVFVDHPKYYDKALESEATVILINKKVDCPDGKALLLSDDPFRDFNKLTAFFKPFEKATSSISETAQIGEGTVIQPHVFVGNNVKIGKNCLIHSNVSIYDGCEIGDHVTIHAGSVLGADAFYYKNRPEGFDKLISGGKVVIKDYVDIGALCTIDKGVSGETSVGEGTKLDNQVHVGHDTKIGTKCLVASQVGIAGCVVIEDEVTIWGQAGLTSGIRIAKGSVILAQSGITKSTEGNKVYFGYPAAEARQYYKEMAYVKKIPELIEKIKKQ